MHASGSGIIADSSTDRDMSLEKVEQQQQHAFETGAALSADHCEAQDGLRFPIAAAAVFLPLGHDFPPLGTPSPIVLKSHLNHHLSGAVAADISGAGCHLAIRAALFQSSVTSAVFSTVAPTIHSACVGHGWRREISGQEILPLLHRSRALRRRQDRGEIQHRRFRRQD
jgi:hypothetical protein